MHTLHKAGALLAGLLLAGILAHAQPVKDARGYALTPTAIPPLLQPAPVYNTVNVSLAEYQVTLDQDSIPAGDVTFLVTNNGNNPHSFAIKGPGINEVNATIILPGELFTASFTGLQGGRYLVYDPTSDFIDHGMSALLQVNAVTQKGGSIGVPHIQVRLTDDTMLLNRVQVPRGSVVFAIVNAGHHRHTFAISGPGLTAALPYSLRPGDSFIYTVNGLHQGSYTLYDPLRPYTGTGLPITLYVGPRPVRSQK